MKFLKSVWKDPVLRTVIASCIIFLIAPFILAVFGCKDFGTFREKYIQLLNTPIIFKAWFIFVCLILVALLTYFFTKRYVAKREDARVIHHSSPYITFVGKDPMQRYCANCWDTNRKLIQLNEHYDGCFECPICHSRGCFEQENSSSSLNSYQAKGFKKL
jgi:hypothetical protein